MNTYLLSWLLYAIPANLVAGVIMYLGKRKQLQWTHLEYPFVYVTWLMFMALAVFIFGSLEAALTQLDIGTALMLFLSAAAGLLGGISLLPRLLLAKIKVHALLVTSISALLLSTLFVKFVMLIFLFMPAPTGHI